MRKHFAALLITLSIYFSSVSGEPIDYSNLPVYIGNLNNPDITVVEIAKDYMVIEINGDYYIVLK